MIRFFSKFGKNNYMKKLSLLILTLFFCNISYTQSLGIGLQSSFPSYGLSAKLDMNDTHSAQVIFGALGIVSNYSARYIYNFQETGAIQVKPFLYSQVGVWSYSFSSFGIDENESTIGYGLGAGLEFNWLNFVSENLKTTVEIGYGKVDLDSYNFAFTTFGFGIHYTLDL